jgi:alpha-beta hydrolase superfamily lysophospholipase
MKSSTFSYVDADGVTIFAYKWLPENGLPKAIVQISHGMQEHAGRYERFAAFLTGAGYGVYANDHRGHGKTALGADMQGRLGPGGWNGAVMALKRLNEIIKREYPGLPVFLLGHSWGSFLAQNFIERWGSELQGVLLSGTHGADPMVGLGVLLARLDVRMRGPFASGGILEQMSVGGLNKAFEPARTPKDWLNRDESEVDRYIADPYCGRPFPNGFYRDLAELLSKTWKPESERRVPKGLPIYLFAGTKDPVGKFTKTVVALAHRYKRYGIEDVTCKFYEGARHETLNETNRLEVMNDILSWLDSRL